MRQAIISDIHSNLEALEAVLRDIDNQNIDHIYCLGDIIGYGPNPNEVTEIIKKRKISSVIGNHDAVITNPSLSKWFNTSARKSVILNIEWLQEENKSFIGTLPISIKTDSIFMVHGCPPDSCLEYISWQNTNRMREIFHSFQQPICFVGHTHDEAYYELQDDIIESQGLKTDPIYLDLTSNKYIINCGSVGQPRVDDKRAAYCIFDDAKSMVVNRKIDYDVEITRGKIFQTNLPHYNAIRLI